MGNTAGKVEPAPEKPPSGRQTTRSNNPPEPNIEELLPNHHHVDIGESFANDKEIEHHGQDFRNYVNNSASKDSFVDLGSNNDPDESIDEEELLLEEQQSPSSRFTRFWRQFLIVFFSPIFPRHRNIFPFIFEVIVPGLVAFIIFAAFTSGISWKQVYYNKVYNTVYDFPELSMETAISEFRDKHADGFGSVLIIYTPVNDFTTDIMRFTIQKLGLGDYNRVDKKGRNARGVVGAQSQVELVERALYHKKENHNHGLPVGIIFNYDAKDIDEITKLPYNVNYSIMSFDKTIHNTADNYPFVSPPKSKSWLSPYIKSGFIGLQYAIEQSIIQNVFEKQKEAEKREWKMKDAEFKPNISTHPQFFQGINDVFDMPDIKLQMFTYANFRNALFRSFVTFAVSFGLVFAYSFMSFFIVRQIVQENISGIKDLLQMHGLPHYVHWASLFFHTVFFRAITTILVVLALRTDFGFGGFVLISFVKPILNRNCKLSSEIALFRLIIIFPNWCLRHMMRTIIDHESDEKGIHWFNIMNIDYVDNQLSVGGGMLILISTSIVYCILAAYCDMTSATKLFPPTSKWYEFKERKRQKKEKKEHQQQLKKDIAEGRATDFEKPAIYEEPDPEKECFVHIRHVTKRFAKHKVALNSVKVKQSALLIVSGSGKTPLLAILSGMMMPSSGYAIIKGHDTNFESKGARQHVGLCTQRLVAFNLLTVREHIILCYRLRGYSQDECDRNCVNLLQRMNLWPVRSHIPDRIKVDELRRLDIALALVGSPEILLFDEPTMGLDALSRREIWDILLSLKNQHTVILTSNIVDEAEFLADRIALLAHGRLICFGSLDFLRRSYDTGYFLKLEHIPGAPPINKNGVMAIIRTHMGANIPINFRNPTRSKDIDSLELELPYKQQKFFADLFEELEKKRANMSVKKLTIKRVSLSDIFIKICCSAAAEGSPADLYVRRNDSKAEIPALPEKAERNHSRYYHIIALLKKRRTVFKSLKISSSLLYSFLPLSIVVMVLFQSKVFVLPAKGNPNRMLTIQPYVRAQDEHLRLFYKASKYDLSNGGYARELVELIQPYGVQLEKDDSMISNLYKVLDEDSGQVGYAKERHMVAFEFRRLGKGGDDLKFDFIGYFASGALHSAPIAINIMSNSLLRAVYSGPSGRHYTVTANNNPMPPTVASPYELKCGITCSLLALVMTFTIAMISHSCVLLPMLERRYGGTVLQ
ncbi:ATP-binding cassette sub-family A member 3, partial [Orchesella cincta]